MKIEAVIETKEELFEFLDNVKYIPSVFDTTDSHTMEGNIGDALPWDLAEYIINHFKHMLAFRSKDPDLESRFMDIAKFFNDKNNECIRNHARVREHYLKETK